MGEEESERRARDYFRDYYSSWKPQAPERLQAREIGFIPFFGTMSRHRKVSSLKEMDSFVKSSVPRHLYYSAAYYRKPDEKRMQDKEWMGAELIFDLDGDHVSTGKRMGYEDMLTMIRGHTVRLIDKFLIKELGFNESDIRIFFSGGRGYHVHVLSDRVYSMTSDSRREIATFIKGDGIVLDDLLRIYRITPFAHGGWIRDMSRGILRAMAERSARTAAHQQMEISEIRGAGVNTQKAASRAMEEVRAQEMSEIDDPVTTDVHRLIRYPGSLHGKTGFEVKEIPHDSLADFDPLSSCIPDIFSDGTERIRAGAQFSIRLHGNRYELKKGENSVPLSVALYGVLSGQAQFI